MQKVVTKCNQLVGESAKVSLESIENGVFPWHVTVNSVDDRVPQSTKRAAVEKQMEIDRFKEELLMIKREMNSFISFYKDRIIPEIDKKKKELQISLNDAVDTGSQVCQLDEDCTTASKTTVWKECQTVLLFL